MKGGQRGRKEGEGGNGGRKKMREKEKLEWGIRGKKGREDG